MPKSKHAPALFELISKPSRTEELAAKSALALSEPDAAAVEGTILTLPPVAPPPRRVELPPPPMAGGGSDGEGTERPWSVSGGRIRFSLSQRGATLALMGAVAVCIAVYLLGSYGGEKRGRKSVAAVPAAPVDGTQQIEDVRRGPVTRKLFEGVGEDPTVVLPAAQPASAGPAPSGGAAPVEPAGVGWVKGHTYIVVQDFRKDARDDAEMAREYLAGQDIESVVLDRSGNYPYRLIAAQGFDCDDPGQAKLAQDYEARIRALGQAYLQAGGRYDFKTYRKKLTADNW